MSILKNITWKKATEDYRKNSIDGYVEDKRIFTLTLYPDSYDYMKAVRGKYHLTSRLPASFHQENFKDIVSAKKAANRIYVKFIQSFLY